MEMSQCTKQCALLAVAVVVLLGVTAQGYMTLSCRQCIHTGDWPACAACYSSKRGIVPFYGMSKRSGGYDDEPEYYAIEDDAPVYEVQKRASHLVSYCCMRLGNQDCCDTLGITPYFGKRSSMVYDDGEYSLDLQDQCRYCIERDSFDFSYCLRCIRKK